MTTNNQSSEYLFSAIRGLEHRASALTQITEFVRCIEDIGQVLDKLLKKVMELAGADAGVIALADSGSSEFKFIAAAWAGISPTEAAARENVFKAVRMDITEGVIGQVYKTGDPQVLSKVSENSRFRKDISDLVRYEIKNLIAVPLTIDDRRLGVLELCNKKPDGSAFTNEDLALVVALSNQIALVMEAHKLREQSGRQVNQLGLLLKSLEIVNSSLALDVVLDNLMGMGMQLIGAEAASILLMDEELGQLYFAAATGAKKEEMKRIYLKKGEGIAGWVADRGEVLLIPDVSKDQRFSKKADKASGFMTKSILAVPLKTEGKLVGVAEAINKKDGSEFNETDAQMLSTLASYGAMAIQKAQLYQDVSELFMATIRALADAIEAKDATTRGRAERIRKLAVALAEEMKLGEKETKDIELAALMHDVGKIAVPDSILNKNENLTEEEYRTLMRVPMIGAEILSPIKQLRGAVPVIRHANERWDGKGYPDRLSGSNIPQGSRVLAVANTFDAMTTDRPYRQGLPDDVALKEMASYAGVQFDPACVEAFIRAYRKGKFKGITR
ncbi:MAG TPA: GAF domain-containing protein [Elusimicrobiota bacterium]|nr:GAF domain-containing protein [Elusimicrobiota bacterium]